jgi:hypothetical protein
MPSMMFNRRLTCNIQYHLRIVFYCFYYFMLLVVLSKLFVFFFFFVLFSTSALGPAILQDKCTFLNKISESVLLGSSFENDGSLKMWRKKKIQTICNKAYFKKRAIFKAKLQFYQTLDYILKI